MPSRPRMLTPLERQYILDAARGMTAQESADRRGVNVTTVRAMLARAKKAQGALNITHSAVLAFLHGDITADEVRNLK